MPKFGSKNVMNTVNNVTVNHEGERAYSLSLELELLGAVVSNFLTDSFYEKEDDRLVKIKNLISQLAYKNPSFVLGLAFYVRQVYNMRTMSHVIIGELSQYFNGENAYFSDLIADSVERIDDIVEILGYLLPEGKVNKRAKSGALSHSLIKGLAKAFNNFDEYQIGKYDRNYAINLKDVVRIIHPNSVLAKKVLDGTVEKPYTWERIISSIPKNTETYLTDVFYVWYDLVLNKKLGYMATIRNLRNILEVADKFASVNRDDADNLVSMIANYISNENAVENSKQLPFRFYSAYKNLPNNLYSNVIKKALSTAVLYSVKNTKLSNRIAVFADVSGSMTDNIHPKSTVKMIDIGLLYTGIAATVSPYSVAGVFGDSVKLKNPTGAFDIFDSYRDGEVGYSTNGYLAIQELTKRNLFVDTIMFFSDSQMYNSSCDVANVEKELKNYMNQVNPNIKCFIFDVGWYGTKVSNMNNVYLVQGWSDKIFQYIDALDSYKDNNIVREIENFGSKYLKR